MPQRLEFLTVHGDGYFTMTELCARFGISRRVGYKWLARFDARGRPVMVDQARAPKSCPHRTPESVRAALCAARRRHPAWGAGLLLDWLAAKQPDLVWPAPSTAHAILRRAGLIVPRRRRRASAHPGVVPPHTAAPNDRWTADFKGQFRTRDGIHCHPLTIADQHARYLLTCHGLDSTKGVGVRQRFERTFREYGLPRAIRTDNGVPFAMSGIHGLSQLNVWWLRLGIQHQRILPGQPQQDGARERMHKTLKREAIRPPRTTRRTQQLAFDPFCATYNTERPHQHLQGTPPGQHYQPSPRPYPSRLPPQEYPGHYLVKQITTGGAFRFQHRLLFIANALIGHHIGLEEIATGVWAVHLNTVRLATLDERDSLIRG